MQPQTILRSYDTVPKCAEKTLSGTPKQRSSAESSDRRRGVETPLDACLRQGMKRPVISFLCIVIVLSLCLRWLDELLFCDDDPGASEICALIAFIGGLWMCACQQRQSSCRSSAAKSLRAERQSAGRVMSSVQEDSISEADGRQRRQNQKRSGAVFIAKDQQIEHRFNEMVEACRRGELASAESQLANLIQDSTCKGSAEKAASETLNRRFGPQIHIMIQACLEAGELCRARAWFDLLASAGFLPNPRSLQAVLESLVQQGETVQAEDFFARMFASGIACDANCLQVLFEHCIVSYEDFSKVEALLKKLRERSSQDLKHGFMAVFRCPSLVSSPEAADRWMNLAVEAGAANSLHLYNAALHACAKFGDSDHAEKWIHKMKEVNLAPDIVSYGAVMDACAQKGDAARAEMWFKRMVDAGIAPDNVSFNTVIKAHARKGNISGAEQWLRRAKENDGGAQLDAFAYNALIAAAARCSDPTAAETWLRQMIQDGATPDVVSYNSVINAWAKRGSASGAERIVTLMCEGKHTGTVEPDVVTLGVALHACARAGELKRAEGMFQRIVARGKTQPDAICFNALINASVKANNIERAEMWLNQMMEAGVPPSVVSYTTVLHAHARAGNVEAAEKGLELMNEQGIEANVVSYSALIHACVKAGDIHRAEKWFEEMRKSGIKANAVSFSALINVCAKAGDYGRAERWLEQMCKDGVPPNVVCYNNVIDACSKAGQPDRAEAWLKRLSSSEDKDLVPTRQSFTTAAQAYATQGAFKDVERILSEMQGYGINMDEFSLTVQLSSYARARPRQREKAEETFLRYTSQGLPITRPPLRVLKSVVGAARYEKLLGEAGVQAFV
eukprot:TRINITY_DN31550_c0_g1_i2.p1 TRINITY_DN31550_c0_g1~~TRINITY_DN31550_c0_g1_i2.p1  ORF type:complete len:849 (-),score=157.68 TRINITY_DN31550_c0_g1_i2:209-2755(-)